MPGVLPALRWLLKKPIRSSGDNKSPPSPQRRLEPVVTQRVVYDIQEGSAFFRVDTSRIFMNRWGSTQFLHYTNKLGKEELTKQAQFADSAVQKVVSAWITPIDFSELASLMDLLHQRRLTHLQNVEHALTTESDPEALVQALAEERIWIAGYEQLIDFLGQGPDCLIRAHEEQLLIFQGRSINETIFMRQYSW